LTREIYVTNFVTCSACSGTRARSPGDLRTCPQCNGTGQLHESRGFFMVSTTCGHCQGSGQHISNLCAACNGEGATRQKQRVRISIPPGVDQGMRLKMKGYGDAGMNGGPPGDLIIVVNVEEHPLFSRDEDRLMIRLPVPCYEASLGVKKLITSLDGKTYSLDIPAGTQSGDSFRIRGAGFSRVHGSGQGDLIVRVDVETPVALTREQKSLMQALQESKTGRNFPKSSKFASQMDK